MDVYIGTEGFTLPNEFLIKEICVYFENNEYNHYLFKPPPNHRLTEVDERTIRYTTNRINGISYHDGDVPYGIMDEVLSRYREYTIYTYSQVALNLLQRALPTTVIINVQELGFKLPSELPDPVCCRQHPARYCAKAKAIAVKNFCKNICRL